MARVIARLFGAAAWMTIAPAACFFPDYTFDLATTSTGGSTTSTTSSAHVMEDCLNGVDDNDDGKVDCEDPDCAAYECVEPVPTGWSSPGYVALYTGPSAQTPPDCPGDMPMQVYAGHATVNAQPAGCSACDCAAPSGQGCELHTDLDPKSGLQPIQIRNAACGASATQITPLTVPDPWGGTCYHDEVLPGGQTCLGAPCNTSVQTSAPTVTGGTCAPTGGVPSRPEPSWASTTIACHGTKQGGGCAGPKVCLPKPESPFTPRVCVEKPGDVECPMGSSFSKKSVYYDDVDDTRDCTKCECGDASGGTCEITITLFSDATVGACSTPVASVKAGQCVAINGNPEIRGRSEAVTKAPSGGTCKPIGQSTPLGNVTPKNPTTFCCL